MVKTFLADFFHLKELLVDGHLCTVALGQGLLDRHPGYLPRDHRVPLDSHECNWLGNLVCFTQGLVFSMNI